ncbi:4'-phosphopantetheinyl transferase family protein [Magnetospira thiophila]
MRTLERTLRRRAGPGRTCFDSHAAPLPAHMTVAPGEVHLWATALDAMDNSDINLEILSPSERARGAALHQPLHRRRYWAAHCLLRRVLAAYTARRPGDLTFVHGPQGKPALSEASESASITFNLSHGGDEFLMAVARDREVGVDVEPLADLPESSSALARAWFTERENRELAALPVNVRDQAFLSAWTRKEAVGKALGLGLGLSPEAVEVSLRPDHPARLRRLNGDRGAADTWHLYHLEPSHGHLGALALTGRAPRIIARRLIPPLASGDASTGGNIP